MLLEVLQCATPMAEHASCCCPQLMFSGGDCRGVRGISRRIRDLVSKTKKDETQEMLERRVVLEFARALPRLRKIWTWRGIWTRDHGPVPVYLLDRENWTCSAACRVTWTIERTCAETRAHMGPEFEVYRAYNTPYDHAPPTYSKILWHRNWKVIDSPSEDWHMVRCIGVL